MLNLSGKVALVTGCGSMGPGWGNGKAIAVLLARQGASVFGADLDLEALLLPSKAASRASRSVVAGVSSTGVLMKRCSWGVNSMWAMPIRGSQRP